MIQTSKRVVNGLLFLAALGGSTLQAAPKKGKAKVSAAKVSYEIEELTVADSKGKGCMMKYQRRHAKGAYDKNVGFNMMCCDYSKDQSCCENKGGENALGFERGCEPVLGARKPWLTPAEMAKMSKRFCEAADQCQVEGGALMAVGAAGFGFGAATFLGGNVMLGTACVGLGGAAAYAGFKAATSRHVELRECAKITDIKFKPNTYIQLKEGNIRHATVMLRTLMTKALFEEHATGVEGVLEQGAHNIDAMKAPEELELQESLEKAAETTGGIVPNPQQQ